MKDTFGKGLYNYWKGDHKTPYIVRRDDGNRDECNLKIYFTNYLYPTEKAVAYYVKGKILDVGCGAGRHALKYQKRGYDITGIDTSPSAIKACKERGCKKVRVMDVFHTNFPLHSFDTIFLFGHNIGISGTVLGAKRLLSSLRKLIKRDGFLLLTSVDITQTTKKIHKKYHQKNREAKRYIGEMKIRVEYKDEIGEWFKWLHLEPKILEELAEETGWKVIKTHKMSHGEYSSVLSPQ